MTTVDPFAAFRRGTARQPFVPGRAARRRPVNADLKDLLRVLRKNREELRRREGIVSVVDRIILKADQDLLAGQVAEQARQGIRDERDQLVEQALGVEVPTILSQAPSLGQEGGGGQPTPLTPAPTPSGAVPFVPSIVPKPAAPTPEELAPFAQPPGQEFRHAMRAGGALPEVVPFDVGGPDLEAKVTRGAQRGVGTVMEPFNEVMQHIEAETLGAFERSKALTTGSEMPPYPIQPSIRKKQWEEELERYPLAARIAAGSWPFLLLPPTLATAGGLQAGLRIAQAGAAARGATRTAATLGGAVKAVEPIAAIERIPEQVLRGGIRAVRGPGPASPEFTSWVARRVQRAKDEAAEQATGARGKPAVATPPEGMGLLAPLIPEGERMLGLINAFEVAKKRGIVKTEAEFKALLEKELREGTISGGIRATPGMREGTISSIKNRSLGVSRLDYVGYGRLKGDYVGVTGYIEHPTRMGSGVSSRETSTRIGTSEAASVESQVVRQPPPAFGFVTSDPHTPRGLSAATPTGGVTVRGYRAEVPGAPKGRPGTHYALYKEWAQPEVTAGQVHPPFEVTAQELTFKRSLNVQGLQGDLLDMWAKQGDEQAARILRIAEDAGRPPPGWYREADTYINTKAAQEGYDGILYNAGERSEAVVLQGVSPPRPPAPPRAPEPPVGGTATVVPGAEGIRALEPGSSRWLNLWRKRPDLQASMHEQQRRLKNELPLDSPGVGVPRPPNGGILDRTRQMWESGASRPVKSVKERVLSVKRRLEEELVDVFAGANRETARARKVWRAKFGEALFPEELDFELNAALSRGAVGAGEEWALSTVRGSLRTLKAYPGPRIDPIYIDQYIHHKHMLEVAAMKGPERLLPGGLTAEDSQRGLQELIETLGPDRLKAVEAAAAHYQQFYRHTLDRYVQSGTIDSGLASTLKTRYPWFSPIVYADSTVEYMAGNVGRLSNTASGIKQLSERGSEAGTLAPAKSIFKAAVGAEVIIAKNDASKSLIKMLQFLPDMAPQIEKLSTDTPLGITEVAQVEGKAIFRATGGPKRGIVQYLEEGYLQTYAVPEWVEREANQLAFAPFNIIERSAMVLNAVPRAALTSHNPGFMAWNFLSDTMTAMITQGVMPTETGMAFLRNLRALVLEDPTFSNMLKAGADPVGYSGRMPHNIANEAWKKGSLLIRREEDWKRWFTRPWDTVRDIGHAIELAPRRAIFEKALDRGSTVRQAALMARRGTIDFLRAGRAIRHLNTAFLYLNPAVQGTALPVRALVTASENYPKARIGMATYMLASVGMYAWNRKFPEYADLALWQKYGLLNFLLPSNEKNRFGNTVAHTISLLPQREWGLYSAWITHILGKMDETSPESTTEFLTAMVPLLNPIEGMTSFTPFSLPYPTYLGRKLNELNKNWDDFRQRPIVGPELEGELAEDQYDALSSELSKRVGGWLNFSPKKIDYLIRSGLGADIVALADTFLRVWQDGENVEAEAIASFVKSIPDNYPAEDIDRLRRLAMSDLSTEMKKAVDEALRKPEPAVPFAKSIIDRFWHKNAGNQRYRSGLSQASREFKIPVDQLKTVNGRLGQLAEELYAGQRQRDVDKDSGIINGREWRVAKSNDSFAYQSVLLSLGIEFPAVRDMLTHPATRQDFYEHIYTLGKKIADTRTKGQILLAAYRSIPVREISPGIEDWPTWNQHRDEFRDILSVSDRELLQKQQEASWTDMEVDFERNRDAWQPYWEVHRELLRDRPDRIAEFEAIQRLSGQELEAAKSLNVWYEPVVGQVNRIKLQMRSQDERLESFLLSYYDMEPVHTKYVEDREELYALQPWRLPRAAEALGVHATP